MSNHKLANAATSLVGFIAACTVKPFALHGDIVDRQVDELAPRRALREYNRQRQFINERPTP